jgi:hypothetical protein
MRAMARPLDNYRPTEPLGNNDTLPEIKIDYFKRKYLKLKAETDTPRVGDTGPRVKDDVVSPFAGNLPSPHMPVDPNGLDPAGGLQEDITAGPDLGIGAAADETLKSDIAGVGVQWTTWHDDGSVTIHTHNYFAGYDLIEHFNEDGDRIVATIFWHDDEPGQPAGGSEGGGGFHQTTTEIELGKKFGGKSPIAINLETGRRESETPRPIATLEGMQLLGLIIDPVTGAVRPKPKPNESGGPGATASDDEGKGTGSGFGPSGDTPGIGGPYGEGKGFGSKTKKEGERTARDAVTQPGSPHDSGGTGDNFLASHEGESPFKKLPLLVGDPSVGQVR